MDLSPFLNLLPQLPFMPLAALILSLVAIAFWDSLAKPFGLEQHRWIAAVVIFVSAILALSQAMHLLWEFAKPVIENARIWKKRKMRFRRMNNGERSFLKRFIESDVLDFQEPSYDPWLQQFKNEEFLRSVSQSPDGYTGYRLDHDLKEFLKKNPQYLELVPKQSKTA